MHICTLTRTRRGCAHVGHTAANATRASGAGVDVWLRTGPRKKQQVSAACAGVDSCHVSPSTAAVVRTRHCSFASCKRHSTATTAWRDFTQLTHPQVTDSCTSLPGREERVDHPGFHHRMSYNNYDSVHGRETSEGAGSGDDRPRWLRGGARTERWPRRPLEATARRRVDRYTQKKMVCHLQPRRQAQRLCP